MAKLKQFKVARRLGAKIFPKTENPKFVLQALGRRKKRRPKPLSEFGLQLLEKQKTRYYYGLRERQFRNYVETATKKRGVNPSSELFSLLERRLDNFVFRLGFVKTRAAARQAVSHGHITVNGRKMTIPSYTVKVGDVIGVRPQSKDKLLFFTSLEGREGFTLPAWVTFDEKKREGKVLSLPALDKHKDLLFNLTSVVEFYSR